MRRRERVVDVNVAERGELRDELRIVVLLALVEAGILEAEDFALPHGGDGSLRSFADAVRCERHRPVEHPGNGRDQRLQRLLRIKSFRTPEMRQQDHLAALVGNFPDGRSRARDAGRIGDLAVLDRHIEVDADQHAFAPDIGLIERAKHGVFVRSTSPSPPRCRSSGWRSPIRCRTTPSPAPACRR